MGEYKMFKELREALDSEKGIKKEKPKNNKNVFSALRKKIDNEKNF